MIISCESCGSDFKRTGASAAKARFCSMKCKSAASGAMDKNCEVCDTTFRAHGAHADKARFCSLACKGVASRVTFDCETCGKNTYGFQYINKRFCSRKCSGEGRKDGVYRNCELCGTQFYVIRARADKGEGRFCTLDCHNEHQGRNKTEHTCKMCGESFRWSPSRTTSKQYKITYCSLACRDADPTRREMLVAMQVIQQLGKMTKTEALGYALLESMGVEYQRQAPFAMKFTPDAVIPSARLVVQFDGDYWHDRKGTSTEPRIMRRVSLDKSQDKYIRACGWEVVRLWESELRDDIDTCRERVAQAISRPLDAEPARDPLAGAA